MTGLFEWLLKLLFIAMLAPFFLCLFGQLFITAAIALLPWMIGLVILFGVAIGFGVRLARGRCFGPPQNSRFPAGEIPRIRRPRGIRTER
jgi:hypothetical protein